MMRKADIRKGSKIAGLDTTVGGYRPPTVFCDRRGASLSLASPLTGGETGVVSLAGLPASPLAWRASLPREAVAAILSGEVTDAVLELDSLAWTEADSCPWPRNGNDAGIECHGTIVLAPSGMRFRELAILSVDGDDYDGAGDAAGALAASLPDGVTFLPEYTRAAIGRAVAFRSTDESRVNLHSVALDDRERHGSLVIVATDGHTLYRETIERIPPGPWLDCCPDGVWREADPTDGACWPADSTLEAGLVPSAVADACGLPLGESEAVVPLRLPAVGPDGRTMFGAWYTADGVQALRWAPEFNERFDANCEGVTRVGSSAPIDGWRPLDAFPETRRFAPDVPELSRRASLDSLAAFLSFVPKRADIVSFHEDGTARAGGRSLDAPVELQDGVWRDALGLVQGGTAAIGFEPSYLRRSLAALEGTRDGNVVAVLATDEYSPASFQAGDRLAIVMPKRI